MWRVGAANLSHLYQKIYHAVKFQNVAVEEDGGFFHDSGQQIRMRLLESCRNFPKGNEIWEDDKQDILSARLYAYGS